MIGLGRYMHRFEKSHNFLSQASLDLKATEEFTTQVMSIIKKENLDPTFLYFSIYSDALISQDSKKVDYEFEDNPTWMNVAEENEYSKLTTLEYLQQLGFKGHRHIVHDFLLPHFLYTRKFSKINHLKKRITIFCILFIKIIVPNYLYRDILAPETIIFMVIFCGFYMHFLSLVYELTINDDLITKNYIMVALEKLISLRTLQTYGEHPEMLDITCPIRLEFPLYLVCKVGISCDD